MRCHGEDEIFCSRQVFCVNKFLYVCFPPHTTHFQPVNNAALALPHTRTEMDVAFFSPRHRACTRRQKILALECWVFFCTYGYYYYDFIGTGTVVTHIRARIHSTATFFFFSSSLRCFPAAKRAAQLTILFVSASPLPLNYCSLSAAHFHYYYFVQRSRPFFAFTAARLHCSPFSPPTGCDYFHAFFFTSLTTTGETAKMAQASRLC